MCVLDTAAKEAGVARFLREYHPQAAQADGGHPALRGCDEVAWSEIPGCPAAIPAVLRGLLDPGTAPEAQRVLTNVLMDNVFQMSAAMPTALPFLLRLVAEPRVPVRSELLDILLVAAELSRPVDSGDEHAVLIFGCDADHPEREQCRAVFAENARLLTRLPTGLISAADRACLEQAAGLL